MYIIHINIKPIIHYFLKYLWVKRQDNYLLAYSYIYQSGSFFLWTGTTFDSLRESGNLPYEIASSAQEVKYSNINPLSCKILKGSSPAVALFQGNPSIASFTVWTLTGWKEKLAWLLMSCLILIKLGWFWNLFKMFWSTSVFSLSVWVDK